MNEGMASGGHNANGYRPHQAALKLPWRCSVINRLCNIEPPTTCGQAPSTHCLSSSFHWIQKPQTANLKVLRQGSPIARHKTKILNETCIMTDTPYRSSFVGSAPPLLDRTAFIRPRSGGESLRAVRAFSFSFSLVSYSSISPFCHVSNASSSS